MFDSWRFRFFWIVTLVFTVTVFIAPDIEYRRWALFGYCVVLWLFHLIPLPITGLLILGLVPVLGILSFQETFSLFGNEAVFFILGVFISSAALVSTGCTDRFCHWLIRRSSLAPGRVIAVLFFGTAFMTFVMPEHASAALILPIAIRYLELYPQSHPRFKAAVILSVAWGAVIGGIVTLLGGARAVLAIELTRMFVRDMGHSFNFGFTDWTKYTLPVFLAVSPVIYVILARMAGNRNLPDSSGILQVQLEKKPWSKKEIYALLIYGLTVLAWIFLGSKIGLGVLALLSAVMMFVFQLLSWEDAQQRVNWGVILLFGGALVLGKVIHQSPLLLGHLEEWIPHFAHTPSQFAIILVVISFILTEFISNTATVALLLPLGLELGVPLGLSPTAVMLSIAIPSGLCFLLPTGTPPNAMAAASGYVTPSLMARKGFFVALWSWLVMIVWILWRIV